VAEGDLGVWQVLVIAAVGFVSADKIGLLLAAGVEALIARLRRMLGDPTPQETRWIQETMNAFC
jgi:hypothetical protein